LAEGTGEGIGQKWKKTRASPKKRSLCRPRIMLLGREQGHAGHKGRTFHEKIVERGGGG